MSAQRTAIASLRKKIAAKYGERGALIGQKRSRAEVREAVTLVCEQADERARSVRALDLKRLAFNSDFPALYDLLGVFSGGREPSPDLGALIVSLIGADKVREAWLSSIDSVPESLDREAKAKRLAEIAQELDALELQEEALIVQSEAEGDPIDRREDVRPEIVLAVPGAFDA